MLHSKAIHCNIVFMIGKIGHNSVVYQEAIIKMHNNFFNQLTVSKKIRKGSLSYQDGFISKVYNVK